MLNLSLSSFVGRELLHCGGADGCFHSWLFVERMLFFLFIFFYHQSLNSPSAALQNRRGGRVESEQKKNIPFITFVFIKVYSALLMDLRAVYGSR